MSKPGALSVQLRSKGTDAARGHVCVCPSEMLCCHMPVRCPVLGVTHVPSLAENSPPLPLRLLSRPQHGLPVYLQCAKQAAGCHTLTVHSRPLETDVAPATSGSSLPQGQPVLIGRPQVRGHMGSEVDSYEIFA